MKARLKIAALVLAGALSSAYAKDGGNGNGPPLEPPGVSGPLGALIDDFLSGDNMPPPGLGNVPPEYRQEWRALFDTSFSHGHGHGTTPPVPEPETYALMLAGLGALAVFAKRRRDN